MNLNFKIDLNDLQLREIGSWPILLRAVLLGIIIFVTLFLFNNLLIRSSLNALDNEKDKLYKLEKDYMFKHDVAVNLEEYRAQMQQIKARYDSIMNEIPASAKIPELITQISNEASLEGLKYDLIKPLVGSSTDNLLMELPINLKLIGSYHGFGRFLSRLSGLERVLTVHDFTVSPLVGPNAQINSAYGSLVFELQIKAYWLAGEASNA